MPVSSFVSLNSWGTYIVAAAALVLLLTPQLAGVARDSRESADWRNLDGVRAAVDFLRPGISMLFSYGIAGVSDSIRFGGQRIYCSDGNGTISLPVTWALPNVTIAPAVEYRFSLVQGMVRVVPGV